MCVVCAKTGLVLLSGKTQAPSYSLPIELKGGEWVSLNYLLSSLLSNQAIRCQHCHFRNRMSRKRSQDCSWPLVNFGGRRRSRARTRPLKFPDFWIFWAFEVPGLLLSSHYFWGAPSLARACAPSKMPRISAPQGPVRLSISTSKMGFGR